MFSADNQLPRIEEEAKPVLWRKEGWENSSAAVWQNPDNHSGGRDTDWEYPGDTAMCFMEWKGKTLSHKT